MPPWPETPDDQGGYDTPSADLIRRLLFRFKFELFSVEEAAAICDTKPGTIKSRISRARARLETAYAKGEIGAGAPDASHD